MSALFILVYAFFFSACAIMVLRPVCIRIGHVDKPGGHKTHKRPTPLSGGIAIVGCIMVLGGLVMPAQQFAGFALGALLLLGVGALDDRRPVPPLLRLALQTVAVGLGMCALGDVRLVDLGSLFGTNELTLGWFASAFTVIAAVGVINAMNMIDGADGIAGSFAIVVTGLVLALGAGSPAVNASLLCLTLGSMLGFLMFNIRTPWQRQARSFLGDAGSMVLGYMLVWFLVSASQGGQAVFDPVTAVWLFGLPVADTNYLIGSRIARGKSPFAADNRHFHHLLQASGCTPQRALYPWLAVAAAFMLIGIGGEWLAIPQGIRVLLFMLAFVSYCFMISRLWRKMERRENKGEAHARYFNGSSRILSRQQYD